MIILSISDVHFPKYMKEFEEKLQIYKDLRVDLVLLGGDLIEAGRGKFPYHYIRRLVLDLRKTFKNIPIISVFGNNEWMEYREFLKREFSNEIIWLDDSSYEFQNIIVIGTEGVLDSLTTWQRRFYPKYREIFERRVERIPEIIRSYKKDGRFIILLSHYAPYCKTVFGDPTPKEVLCSEKFWNVLKDLEIDLILHGHAHYSTFLEDDFNDTKIVNIAFPAREDFYIIKI